MRLDGDRKHKSRTEEVKGSIRWGTGNKEVCLVCLVTTDTVSNSRVEIRD